MLIDEEVPHSGENKSICQPDFDFQLVDAFRLSLTVVELCTKFDFATAEPTPSGENNYVRKSDHDILLGFYWHFPHLQPFSSRSRFSHASR